MILARTEAWAFSKPFRSLLASSGLDVRPSAAAGLKPPCSIPPTSATCSSRASASSYMLRTLAVLSELFEGEMMLGIVFWPSARRRPDT